MAHVQLGTFFVGPQGEQGPAGPEGPQGPQGIDGVPGPQGVPGESIVGPPGATGPAGPQGETGKRGPVGPAGADGATGPRGTAGVAATIAVGEVSTLPPGSPVVVRNVGTENAAVFDIGIPQGAKGANGVGFAGPPGPPGAGAPLSTDTPQPLGTPTAGVDTEGSPSDHVHAHGDQLGGTLHALATTSIDGFMSALDKARLDITPVAYITYQKDGISGGGIVATWAEVDTFAVAAQSPWVLFIDNSLGQCDVPATADTDFRNLVTIRHSGAAGGNALIARDGCRLRNIGQMGTNSQIMCEAFTVTPVLCETPNTVTIFREGGSIVLDDVGGTPAKPAIEVTNGQQILAFLEGGSIGTVSGASFAGAPVITFSVVGSFHIIFQLVNSRGGNGIIDNIIEADPTTTFINGHDQTANLGDQSLFAAGTFIDNPIGLSKWMSWESGDTASRPSGAQVGRMYFDTDVPAPVWWDGSAWVSLCKSYSETVGDGVATTFDIDHNLGTRDVTVQLYETTTYNPVTPLALTRTTVNRVTVGFAAPPASNWLRVVIQGTKD